MLLAAGTTRFKSFMLRDGERSSPTFAVRRRRDFYPRSRHVSEQLSRWPRMQSIWLMPFDSIASLSWVTTGVRVPLTQLELCFLSGYQHWRLYHLVISRAAFSRFLILNSRRDFGISGCCVSTAGQKRSGGIRLGSPACNGTRGVLRAGLTRTSSPRPPKAFL